MQRLLDIIFSGAALLVLIPLFIPIMLVLRFTGEGEVFFLQNRVGQKYHLFKLIKFATMLKASPNMGTGTVTLKDDPRVLPIGRFLRKTKINELPQLLNILKGDMSIIGPRPQTQRCFDAFPKCFHNKIIKVRPGLSGIGSIVFRREEDMINEESDPDYFYDEIIMPYKARLEKWYVENNGFVVYLMCIFLTIWVVARPNSSIIWYIFPNLTPPPDELVQYVNWPGVIVNG